MWRRSHSIWAFGVLLSRDKNQGKNGLLDLRLLTHLREVSTGLSSKPCSHTGQMEGEGPGLLEDSSSCKRQSAVLRGCQDARSPSWCSSKGLLQPGLAYSLRVPKTPWAESSPRLEVLREWKQPDRGVGKCVSVG